ncbi:MAG: hypothetical protein JRG80_22685, partial [Deltaproteobacteria bacterium]|nr:hypothetical protein [Deltaproteobacteria bacterium]
MHSRASRFRRIWSGGIGPGVTVALVVFAATSAVARPGAVPDALAATAAARGSVRVIAGLDVPFEPEGRLRTPADVAAQRGRIHSAQDRI